MFPCTCCGHLTMTEEPPGTFGICPVCFWEDDPVQGADPTASGGANAVSLIEARDNYRTLRASDVRFVELVRDPLPAELSGQS